MTDRLAFVGMVFLGLATAACTGGTSNVPATNLLDLINQKRMEAGCLPVAGDAKLRVAAERHVVDMRDNKPQNQPGADGHTGSDGSKPETRIADAGYAYSKIGEIVYWSESPSDEVKNVNWWMNSPPHKALILDCDFKHAGVGLVYPGGTKWYSVVDFGSPQ